MSGLLHVQMNVWIFCVLFSLCMYVCQKHAKGQELFMKVCDHLNLLEKDYYGLAIWETPTMKVSGYLMIVAVFLLNSLYHTLSQSGNKIEATLH